MGMGMMGVGFLMMLLGLLILIGLIAVVVAAVLHFTGSARPRGPIDPQARQILDQRYAKGEIDEEEYQRRRRALG
jgi:putative membrane protein